MAWRQYNANVSDVEDEKIRRAAFEEFGHNGLGKFVREAILERVERTLEGDQDSGADYAGAHQEVF